MPSKILQLRKTEFYYTGRKICRFLHYKRQHSVPLAIDDGRMINITAPMTSNTDIMKKENSSNFPSRDECI
jgi:hypothetical protein